MLHASLSSEPWPGQSFVSLFICLSHSAALSKRCKLGLQTFTMGFPKDSSFLSLNFVLLSAGVPLDKGVKEGYPLKRCYFAAIGSFSVKAVADGHRHAIIITSTDDRLFRFININDLVQPLTPKKGFLVNFLQFLAAAHISTLNCDEMPEDRLRQPAYESFSIKRRF